ncbi:PAS domain-containing protein, partial [Bacillus cereus group sp. BC317]
HGMPVGYQPTLVEALGFYEARSQERIRAAFTACCEQGVSFDEELEIVTQHHQRRWVRVIGRAVRDELGQIIQVQGSTQDITQRKAT